MKPDILLIEPMMPQIEKALDDAYTVHRFTDVAALAGVAGSIRGIATGGGSGVPADVMAALPELGIIAINGIGTDAVDLNVARQRGIRVTTTPGVLTADVADMALGLILMACRGLGTGDRYVRAGSWGKAPIALGHTVTGRKLGILGLGQVGRAIAARARAFDMPIAYHDIREIPESGYTYFADLTELARDSDVLVVAASGGAQSRNIVDKTVLEALGPDGVLINVARGTVVDEDALVAALQAGTLGGAGLDVFQHEPHVPDALKTMDNVALQPHRASATVETRLAMGDLVVRNLAAWFAGQSLLTPVV
ncbi:D-isomer specific 2-hydroxyacid dehydrogenase NAD-binding [Gluconacetobacter diazotrophicus PA1 5]|uniref:D-2-hydroxyacid dehydrogensase n=2 Tax=Gluconacetobacter diazotrophicus TaxID=33996 RepID=A9HDT4_GLUDA|nr:2-hydroxyacid dehydrogenase [Gluconacetobacter diazotrophicus]ACI51670.1 D-isomer specific 2-hydroxyacid dehydrogenase NAD-binding [Gluconacetobacter diazotrophicus PA1 5]MBB2155298.1 2-hydroxyacid dehydrogenase [Gluconacetobacter diazotrophicus]TWB11014.1 lactate dehydrogenase-like 2-hydroxyacid dehydrogenase [Gluconacetobacter diazotrophicus]CAP55140.1 D-2-hydroxyacid dehydrogensase [Gluconacetobacter diazotrophicus PA1 5]